MNSFEQALWEASEAMMRCHNRLQKLQGQPGLAAGALAVELWAVRGELEDVRTLLYKLAKADERKARVGSLGGGGK